MSLNPFKPAQEQERSRRWIDILKPSKQDNSDREEVLGVARSFLEWSAMPYHARFVRFLEREADKPVEYNEQIVLKTARANAFKEVLQYLKHEESRARIALEE